MSTFEQQVEIGNSEGKRFEAIEAMVDTGASYTPAPDEVFERIGISPEEERPFIHANGQRVAHSIRGGRPLE